MGYRKFRGKNRGRKKPRGMKRGHRGRNRKNRAVITQMRGKGLADMLYVKLTYVDRIQITSTLVSYMPYIFSGNSLYDTDQTATGHQPLYFDQYSLLYDKYRVIGSSIQLDVINYSGTQALYYVCDAATVTNTFTDVPSLLEQSRSTSAKIVPIAARIPSRLKRYVSTAKVCGLTKTQVYDDTFAATSTSNPGNLWYWNLLFQSMDGLSVVNGYFVVKLSYYVQFFDRKLVSQS